MRNHALGWRWLTRASLAVYCLWSILLILANPGFQYDEALLVLGSVHMRQSAGELTLPHDPDTWICPFGRCIPLMTVRYAGAIKEYLCLPLFAIFGPGAEIVRLVSMLLGLLGIWGLARLLRHAAPGAGALAAAALAMHPAYVDLTVFDNGTVAVWMAAMGLFALALSGYLHRQTLTAALCLGAAAGLGIWARANFVWFLGAVFVTALIVFRGRIPAPLSHWAAAAIGGIAGGFPFLLYQAVSRGGTWEALDMFTTTQTFLERLSVRLVQFSEVLLSDREHRAIWGGTPLPAWQAWTCLAAVVFSCVACLVSNSRWPRACALTLLVSAAFLFLSRAPVAEHHLIALVPLSVAVVVLASMQLTAGLRHGAAVGLLLGAVYLTGAAYWQFTAISRLHSTGGVGQWSDGVYTLARILESDYRGRDIRFLDWGLQNNLYVITDGAVRSREIFPIASPENCGFSPAWSSLIREGGVYLISGPGNRYFPAAAGFEHTLALTRPVVRRRAVPERSGGVYAEILDIEPGTAREPVRMASLVRTADPASADQLDGFHQVEEGAWRWSKPEFSIRFGTPAPAGRAGGRLSLELYIPEVLIRRLGSVTVSARLAGCDLGPERYQSPGRHTFVRGLGPAMLAQPSVSITFQVAPSLSPTETGARPLGIVVSSGRLDLSPE